MSLVFACSSPSFEDGWDDEIGHKHKCPNDGVVWAHSSLDEDRTHVCTVCGLATFDIYDGPDPVTPPEAIAAIKLARSQMQGAALAEAAA
jgi:hypothetical protein